MNPSPIGLSLPSATMSASGETPGLMTTSSPTATLVTDWPTASTIPATSHPGTCGNGGLGRPLVTHRSMWFSALALTRTCTWSAPSDGRSMSPRRYWPGASSRIHARMGVTLLVPHDAASDAHRQRVGFDGQLDGGRGSPRTTVQRHPQWPDERQRGRCRRANLDVGVWYVGCVHRPRTCAPPVAHRHARRHAQHIDAAVVRV